MAFKTVRILYQAKAFTTGLSDVKGQVYFNDVAKAVGGSALAFSELDSTNAPGVYFLDISPSQLTTWGAVATGANVLEVIINSTSKPAQAVYKNDQIVASDGDDIAATLGSPAGASVSADIAAVKSDTGAIKADLESGSNSLANIMAGIQAIQNNAGFALSVPGTMTVPGSGSNTYRVPITIYNEKNQLIDPDSNSITVALANTAGTDRGSYLTGYSGGTAPAVRDSLGQYHIDIVIPSSATLEDLLATFSYAIGGSSVARRSQTQTVSSTPSGTAQQSTLLAVQTSVNAIQADLETGANDLATIDANIASFQTAVQGTGFSSGTDSLHQIAQALSNLYSGGKAF